MPKTAIALRPSAAVITPATDRALFTWADSTTDATSERRDDLIRDKTRAVADFFTAARKPPTHVTPDDVKAWQADLESRGLAPATVYAMLSRVSSFYTWAAKDPDLAARLPPNPVRLARPRAPRAYQSDSTQSLDDQQVRTLLLVVRARASQGNLVCKRDYAMLMFYLLTGLRREEIARLRWGDLKHLDDGEALTLTTRVKGGERRTIELRNPIAWRALQHYLNASSRLPEMTHTSPLWTRHDRAGKPGPRLTSHAFVKNLKRYAALAGIPSIHLHQTRHTYARIVADESGSLTDTQEALDHKNLPTTRHYVRRITTKRDKFSSVVAEHLNLPTK